VVADRSVDIIMTVMPDELLIRLDGEREGPGDIRRLFAIEDEPDYFPFCHGEVSFRNEKIISRKARKDTKNDFIFSQRRKDAKEELMDNYAVRIQ